MGEESAISDYSMNTGQLTVEEDQNNTSILKNHMTSLLLVILGFYFLVFAIVELVTNYAEDSNSCFFSCDDSYVCRCSFEGLSFAKVDRVYLYLSNIRYTQHITEGVNIDTEETIINCTSYATNEEMGKTVALSGASLTGSNLAYPCGKIALTYPESTLTLTNTDDNILIPINTTDLSITSYSFINLDQTLQWADVTSSHYNAWSEKNIALGFRKLWGFTETMVSGDFEVVLTALNPIKEEIRNGLKLEITDNLALSGYNLPLCIFNFIWSLMLFLMACFSFYSICKENLVDNKSDKTTEVIKLSFTKTIGEADE